MERTKKQGNKGTAEKWQTSKMPITTDILVGI